MTEEPKKQPEGTMTAVGMVLGMSFGVAFGSAFGDVSNGLLLRPNAIVYIFIAMGLATFHRESSTGQKH